MKLRELALLFFLGLVTVPSALADLNTGLVSAWNLTSLTDTYGALDLTNSGGVATTTSGCIYQGCYEFTGANTELYYTDYNINTGKVSISMWADSDVAQTGGWDTLIRWSDGDDPVALYYDGNIGGVGAYLWTEDAGGTTRASNGSMSIDNTMHHYVITLDITGRMLLYVDGIVLMNSSVDSFTGDSLNDNNDFTIGGRNWMTTENFDGVIDEVYVWNRELTKTEALELYNSSNGKFCTGDPCSFAATPDSSTYFSVTAHKPENNAQVNTTTFDANFTVTGNQATYSCNLYVNNTVSGTGITADNNTAEAITSSVINVDNTYSWYVNCSSGSITNISVSRNVITFTPPPTFSVTAHKPENNAQINVSTFDANFTVVGNQANYTCNLYVNDTISGTGITADNNTAEAITSNALINNTYSWHINCSSGSITNISVNRNVVIAAPTLPVNLLDGLVAVWNMSSTVDSYGSYDITASGATVQTSSCVSGSCYVFDGISDKLTRSNFNIDTYNFTFSWWADSSVVQSSGDYNTFFRWTDDGSTGDVMSYFGGYGSTGYSGVENNSDDTLAFSYTPGGGLSTDLHHYVMSASAGGNLSYWVDGVKVASESVSTTLETNNNMDLTIGNRPAVLGSSEGFDGIIDEFYVWNRNLSQTEVSKLYRGGSGYFCYGDPCSFGYPPGSFSVSITDPEDDAILTTNNQFNITIKPEGVYNVYNCSVYRSGGMLWGTASNVVNSTETTITSPPLSSMTHDYYATCTHDTDSVDSATYSIEVDYNAFFYEAITPITGSTGQPLNVTLNASVTFDASAGSGVNTTIYAGSENPRAVIVQIGDMQTVAEQNPSGYVDMMEWIANVTYDRNIVAVFSVGDIIETKTSQTEWETVNESFSIIDQLGIPVIIGRGDHEVWPPTNGWNSSIWDSMFPESRYSGEDWFVNSSNSSLLAYSGEFMVGNTPYLGIGMRVCVHDEDMVWLNATLNANKDKNTILVRHNTIGYSGNLHNGQTAYTDYGCSENFLGDMWNKILRHHDQLKLIFGGHNGVASLTKQTDGGTTVRVYQVDYAGTDETTIRLYTFEDDNKVYASSYDPVTGVNRTDSANKFSFSLDTDFTNQPLTTKSLMTSGDYISAVFDNLAYGRLYNWYVETQSSLGNETSDYFSFTTIAPAQPLELVAPANLRVVKNESWNALFSANKLVNWSVNDFQFNISTMGVLTNTSNLDLDNYTLTITGSRGDGDSDQVSWSLEVYNGTLTTTSPPDGGGSGSTGGGGSTTTDYEEDEGINQSTYVSPRLIHYYALNNNTLDYVGGHDGTPNALTYSSSQLSPVTSTGYSALFDGIDSYVNLGTTSWNRTNRGFTAYAKITGDTGADQVVVAQYDSGGYSNVLYWDRENSTHGKWALDYYLSIDTAKTINTSVMALPEGWVYLAFGYDMNNKEIKLWVDDTKVNASTLEAPLRFSTYEVDLGAKNTANTPQLYFKGYLDEVRFYNDTITDDDKTITKGGALMNLKFYDEVTKVPLTNIYFDIVSDTFSNNYTTTTSGSSLVLTNNTYEIIYRKDGFYQRRYYANLRTNTNTTINLYLLNESNTYASLINYEVTDGSGVPLPSMTVKALRFFPSDNAYKTVEMSVNGDYGTGIMHLETINPKYRFMVINPSGEVIKITDGVQLSDSNVLIRVNLADNVLTSSNVVHGNSRLYFTNVTNSWVYLWNDDTDIINSVCMNVTKYRYGGSTLINNSCVTGSSAGVISLGIGDNPSGIYRAHVRIHTNTQYSPQDLSGEIVFTDTFSYLGNTGVFYGAMIIIVLALTGMFMLKSPYATIILTIVGYMVSGLLGLIPLTLASIIGVLVIGGMFMFFTRKVIG